MLSDNSLTECSASNDTSFDSHKRIDFLIVNINQFEDIITTSDKLIDTLLNVALQNDSKHFSCKLKKPSILSDLLENPLKLSMKTLRINDNGFSHKVPFSYFNDISLIIKRYNIILEVTTL